MQEFQTGPFSFDPVGRPLTVNGQASQRWAMSYGDKHLAEKTIAQPATAAQIAEAFGDDRAAFIRSHQPAMAKPANPLAGGTRVRLVQSTGATGVHGQQVGEFLALAPIDGISRGLIDDRFATWAVSELGCVPMEPGEFARLQAAHEAIAAALQQLPAAASTAPAAGWVADLLPDDVLTDDAQAWRPPTSWELRHVVGEGSFTGISGAKAAQLVGVEPQSFRKYTAREGAASRQKMSFAMWHLLLHKLGVKAA